VTNLATLDPAPSALDLDERAGMPAWVAMLEPTWQLSKRLERAAEFIPAAFVGRAEAIMAAILTGLEVGQGPLWSLRSIYVVNGRPGLYAEAQRALVLGRGHELWPVEQTGERATWAGRRRGSEHTVQVTWTMADATRARLPQRNPTWKDYPRQMLTARASSELVRLVFPDVTGGVPSAEELADGVTLGPVAVLDSEPRTVRRQRQAPATPTPAVAGPPAPSAPAVAPAMPEPALPYEDDDDEQPAEAEVVEDGDDVGEPVDLVSRQRLMAMTTKAFPGIGRKERESFRHALTALVTRDRDGGPVVHFADLDDAELLGLSARLEDVRAGRLLVAAEPTGAIVATTSTKQAVVMPPGAEGEAWSVVIEDRDP
jgi:hypothetical protein